MSEESALAVRFLVFLVLLPAIVKLSRRALGGRPAHLTDEETHSLRLLSFGGVGALMALIGASFVPWLLTVILAPWTALVVVRIGSRLHLANPLRARFEFGQVEVIDDFNARIECANGQSLHPVTSGVARFLDAEAAGPGEPGRYSSHGPYSGRVISRGRLKALPALLDDELKELSASRDVRRTTRDELAEFLLDARECGCLVLEPDTDDTDENDPSDEAGA